MKFCPKLEPVTEDIEELNYSDKFRLIEKEAQSLYSFCLKKGFSDREVKECVSKLYGPAPSSKTKKVLLDSSRSLLWVTVMVAVTAAMIQSPTAYNFVCANLKIASIKFILPYFNWADYYNEDCLVNNMYLPEEKVTYDRDYCTFCINVRDLGKNAIDRLTNTTPEEVNKHYINHYQPVVITDTTKDWTEKKKIVVDDIMQLYLHDPVLSQNLGSCFYKNSVGLNKTLYDFHNAYAEKKLPEKWHANWVNCDTRAAKILRLYYTRPYFLPQMAQASSSNMLLVAKGKQDEWFEVTKDGLRTVSAIWVTVVQGSLRVKLKPIDECIEKFQCLETFVDLGAGETVFVTGDELWNREYQHNSEDITLAIGSSVIWD